MNDSVNGQLFISYDFSQNYYVDDNPLYRLDRLADYSFDRMMYHRADVRHYVSNTIRFLRPTAMLEWHPLADDESGDRMKTKAEYSMSATSPGLLNLLNIVDESDPLNIRTGNPALKDTRTSCGTSRRQRFSRSRASTCTSRPTTCCARPPTPTSA